MKRIIVLSIITVITGCGLFREKPVDEPLEVLNGTASKEYVKLTETGIVGFDTVTPIVKAGEKGMGKLDTHTSNYTGQLNPAAIALALRKIIADDIVFGSMLLGGHGDCATCRIIDGRIFSNQISLMLPTVNYSKTISSDEKNFITNATNLYKEIDARLFAQKCVAEPGRSDVPYYEAPISDQKTFFIVSYACVLPEFLTPTAEKVQFNRVSIQSDLTEPLSGIKRGPVLTRDLIITQDRTDPSLINAAVITQCAGLMRRGVLHNMKLSASEIDLCLKDDLGFRKEYGWTKLTTQIVWDAAGPVATIDVDGPTWSGIVPSPYQNSQILLWYPH